jgi:hypothetical protein
MALKKIMTTFSTNGVEKISNESEIVNDYDELYFDTDTDRILMPDRAGMKEVLSSKIGTPPSIVNSTFDIPQTGNNSSWVNLGTWTTVNEGTTLYMRIVAHNGYNTESYQNQVTELYFKTSNSQSNKNGFYGDGSASRNTALGSNSFAPSVIRVVQNSLTSYTIFGLFATWSNGSHYVCTTNSSSTWNHIGTLVGSQPSGTFVDIVPQPPNLTSTTVQNAITLGATGTAPAATTRTVQRIESQTLGDKLKLIYKLGQTSAGRNDGSGDYLLTLPNNIAFNTTYHPVFTGAIWTGGVNNMAQYFIPAYGGIVIDSHWTNQIMVVPYDATRFRLALTNNNSQTTYGFWSSSWYSTSAASGISLQLQFEIWAAEPPAPPMLGARRPPV